jgi:hypothetical protein
VRGHSTPNRVFLVGNQTASMEISVIVRIAAAIAVKRWQKNGDLEGCFLHAFHRTSVVKSQSVVV